MDLRIALGKRVPWFACSATLSPATIKILKERCGFANTVQILRTPIDRPELTWKMGVLPQNPGARFEALRFLFHVDLLHKRLPVSPETKRIEPSQITKTIIFFNSRAAAHLAMKALMVYLRQHPDFRYSRYACLEMLKVYTRDTPEREKESIIEKFRKPGESSPIRVVFANEALGLGVDLPDIRRVVQYGLTQSKEPSVLWQRGGRACRDHEKGEVILLVEHWAVGASRILPSKDNRPVQESIDDEEGNFQVQDEDQVADESAKARMTQIKDAKRRGLLPHFWYHLINNEQKCL
ncbi:hypothetical protein KEM56_005272, partial [Ascosphaera pollenicola]